MRNMRGLPSPDLPPRNGSWPLSATDQRYYSLQVRRHRRPSNHAYPESSSSSDSDVEFPDGPDDASANDGSSSSSSTGSQLSDILDVDIVLWTTDPAETAVGARPSTMAVLTRFLGLVFSRTVLIVGGMLIGSLLTYWYCSMAAASTTAPTPPPTAAQQQRQELMGRLATDLQMLHWDALQAFGVASTPGAAVSDADVKACLKTVGKRYRYLAGVWHPDRCVYEEAGLLAEWQCNELYKATVAKKDPAFFGCLGSERRVSAASQSMWRNAMEEGEGGGDEL